MKTITIRWIKEMRGCVPFFIFIDGYDCGIIKRGDALAFNVGTDTLELYFVPKAPAWYGWQALKLRVKLYGDLSEIHLAVRNDRLCNDQLHSIVLKNMEVISKEYVKKYK